MNVSRIFIERPVATSVLFVSILALLSYRRYSRGIDAAYSVIFNHNWALGAFIVGLFAAPLLILFYL